MGTIPRSSSHSPFATEAACGVRLLLFWPAELPDTRPGFSTHGFQVMPVTASPSGCPFVLSCDRTSGTKCHSGCWCHFPEDLYQLQIFTCRSTFTPVALWLNRWKNVSGFIDLPGILNRSSFARASALLMCIPEGMTEPDLASAKKPFPVPHHLSSLLSLTW